MSFPKLFLCEYFSAISSVLLVSVLLSIPPCVAQDLSEMGIQDVAKQAVSLVQSGEFAKAKPFLQHMISELEEMAPENDTARNAFEFALFHIGAAHYQLDSFDEAIETFNRYLKSFPSGRWYLQAHLMTMESFAILQKWTRVVKSAETVLSLPRLTRKQRFVCCHAVDCRSPCSAGKMA